MILTTSPWQNRFSIAFYFHNEIEIQEAVLPSATQHFQIHLVLFTRNPTIISSVNVFIYKRNEKNGDDGDFQEFGGKFLPETSQFENGFEFMHTDFSE